MIDEALLRVLSAHTGRREAFVEPPVALVGGHWAAIYGFELSDPPPDLMGPLVLRVMPLPADLNANGDIFGGWIMAQVDVAGGIVAGRVARGRVATVSVNSFVFKQPVQIGDILSLYADVVRIGNTSITVDVQVYAERGREEATVVKVTEAALTYVAIDLKGKPRPVPK